ncbi:TPA: glycosyltransferase family 4 protein [Bacillus albus]
MKKINIIGPYPPPMGGISVHIKRMKAYLESKDIQCVVYDEFKQEDLNRNIYAIKKYKMFLFKIPFLKGNIIHFHSLDKRLRMLLGLYKILGKNIILTVHGQSLVDQINSSGTIVRYLLINSLKKIDKIICVNEINTKELIGLGFNKEKIITLSAYINPIESKEDYEKIPSNIQEFIESKDFIICANGCVRFYNGQDLYGIDLLIDLVKELILNGRHVKLLFAVLDVQGQNDHEKNYYEKLKRRINEYGLDNQILLFEVKDTEFYPIVKRSKLFIRPTNVDGFGVSIAEAIYYGIPAIASNVCKRPDGTIIFKSRDYQDLYKTVSDVIDNYERYRKGVENISVDNNGESLLKIYKQVNVI